MRCCYNLQLPLPDKYAARRYGHSLSTLQLGPHCMWLILFGGWYYKSNTVIIELSKYYQLCVPCSACSQHRCTADICNSSSPPVQGGDEEWSVGRVLKNDTLSNNTVYQDMLREGKWNGLPAVVELKQKIKHLQKKVSISNSGQQ